MTDSHDDYGNLGSTTGYLLPISHSTITDFPAELLKDRGSLLPARRKRAPKALLNGNIARRNSAPGTVDHVVWDTVLAGFGLQVRASSNNSWIVQYRQRGKLKKVTLGRCVDVDANDARAKARAMLAAAALDGLPTLDKHPVVAPRRTLLIRPADDQRRNPFPIPVAQHQSIQNAQRRLQKTALNQESAALGIPRVHTT